MGLFQAEQPLLGKEVIRPVTTIDDPFRDATAFNPFAKKASQPATEPAVFVREDVRVAAVFEVLEPTAQRLIHLLDDAWQALTPGLVLGLGPTALLRAVPDNTSREADSVLGFATYQQARHNDWPRPPNTAVPGSLALRTGRSPSVAPHPVS